MTIGTTKTFTVRCSAETEAKALARVEAEIEPQCIKYVYGLQIRF